MVLGQLKNASIVDMEGGIGDAGELRASSGILSDH
jgi:hypothetical protein